MTGAKAGRWLLAGVLFILLVGLVLLVARQEQGQAGALFCSGCGRLTTRLLLVAVSLGLWFLTQSLIGGRSCKDGQIGDLLHDLSAPWNRWLQGHEKTTNAILIISSAFIDLFAIYLIGTGLLGATLRPFIALLILFAFRQVCQALCALPVPPGMIWRNPGFPSLLVTYGVSNDFFISGHTAIAVLGAIEIAHGFPPGIGVAVGIVAALEGLTVIVLRAHYTLDVLGAVVAAFCAAGLAATLCRMAGI